jgi:hypothetical protein
MAGSVRRLLRGSKDAALGVAARSFLNARLRGIGELTELSINTEQRTAKCRVQLVGEPAPIDVVVRNYILTKRGSSMSLTIKDVASSREWLTAALQAFVVGRPFRIPPVAAASLTALA